MTPLTIRTDLTHYVHVLRLGTAAAVCFTNIIICFVAIKYLLKMITATGVTTGIVTPPPPLCDIKSALTSEHFRSQRFCCFETELTLKPLSATTGVFKKHYNHLNHSYGEENVCLNVEIWFFSFRIKQILVIFNHLKFWVAVESTTSSWWKFKFFNSAAWIQNCFSDFASPLHGLVQMPWHCVCKNLRQIRWDLLEPSAVFRISHFYLRKIYIQAHGDYNLNALSSIFYFSILI